MGVAQRHDKEQPVLLVLEEQVLGVPAGQLALELGAFGHREHRLVLQRSGGDAELIEAGEQVLSGGGHGAGSGLRREPQSYPSGRGQRNWMCWPAARGGGSPARRQSANGLPAGGATGPAQRNDHRPDQRVLPARACQWTPSCCIRPPIAGLCAALTKAGLDAGVAQG